MSVGDIVGRFTTYVINPVLLVLAAAGFFFFVWGLVEFMFALSQGNESKSKEGKQHMLWGTIGMVIMFSVAGIIALVNATFNFGIAPNQPYTPNTNVPINTNTNFFQ